MSNDEPTRDTWKNGWATSYQTRILNAPFVYRNTKTKRLTCVDMYGSYEIEEQGAGVPLDVTTQGTDDA